MKIQGNMKIQGKSETLINKSDPTPGRSCF